MQKSPRSSNQQRRVVIDVVMVQNLLAPLCCALGKTLFRLSQYIYGKIYIRFQVKTKKKGIARNTVVFLS